MQSFIQCSLFFFWSISDHFQVVLVGGFTIGVRASCHRALCTTLNHWLEKIHHSILQRPFLYLGWKCESEANVDKDEEDKSEEFLAKLVVILFVGELVGVLHESIGDCGEKGGCPCGSPKIVQGRVTLETSMFYQLIEEHESNMIIT